MKDKIFAIIKDGKPVSYAETERAAWDKAAIKADVSNWWLIHWSDDSAKEQIIDRGFGVRSATVTIDREDD